MKFLIQGFDCISEIFDTYQYLILSVTVHKPTPKHVFPWSTPGKSIYLFEFQRNRYNIPMTTVITVRCSLASCKNPIPQLHRTDSRQSCWFVTCGTMWLNTTRFVSWDMNHEQDSSKAIFAFSSALANLTQIFRFEPQLPSWPALRSPDLQLSDPQIPRSPAQT